MVRAKKYLLGLVIIVIILSCENPVEIPIKNKESKMVINSVLKTDRIIELKLSASKYILDKNNDILKISDANVKLFEDDNFIGNFDSFGEGNYIMNYTPKLGKNYKVEVVHDKYKTVSAESRVLMPISVVIVDTMTIKNNNTNDKLRMKVNFTDPSSVKNYYIISFISKTTYCDDNNNCIDDYYDLYVETDDVIMKSMIDKEYTMFEVEKNTQYKSFLFSDELINGENYTATFDIGRYFYEDLTHIVVLNSISEDLFKYIVTLQEYNSSGGFMSEPVMVYSNVKNGIGIFGSMSASKDSIFIIGNQISK